MIFIYLFIYLFICLFVCLFIYLFLLRFDYGGSDRAMISNAVKLEKKLRDVEFGVQDLMTHYGEILQNHEAFKI
jgi:hypothetical protein